MSRRDLTLLAFGLLVAAQLAVPALSILGHERTLWEGRVFKFMTRPVDPADAFRGRYVWLSLEPGTVKVPDAGQWHRRRPAFAVLGTETSLVRTSRSTPGCASTAGTEVLQFLIPARRGPMLGMC